MMKIKQLTLEDIGSVSNIIRLRDTARYYDSSRVIGTDNLSNILLDENCYVNIELVDKSFNYDPYKDLIWQPNVEKIIPNTDLVNNDYSTPYLQHELSDLPRTAHISPRVVQQQSSRGNPEGRNFQVTGEPPPITNAYKNRSSYKASILGLIENDILRAFTVINLVGQKGSYYGGISFMMSDPRFSTVENNFHLLKQSIERLHNTGSGAVYFLTSTALMNTEYGKILNDYDAMNISNNGLIKLTNKDPLALAPQSARARTDPLNYRGGSISSIAKNMLIPHNTFSWPYPHTVYCLRRKSEAVMQSSSLAFDLGD